MGRMRGAGSSGAADWPDEETPHPLGIRLQIVVLRVVMAALT